MSTTAVISNPAHVGVIDVTATSSSRSAPAMIIGADVRPPSSGWRAASIVVVEEGNDSLNGAPQLVDGLTEGETEHDSVDDLV